LLTSSVGIRSELLSDTTFYTVRTSDVQLNDQAFRDSVRSFRVQLFISITKHYLTPFVFLIRSSGNEVCCRSWRPGCHDDSQEQSAALLFSSLHTHCPFSTTFAVDAGLLWAILAMLRDTIKDTPLTELHI